MREEIHYNRAGNELGACCQIGDAGDGARTPRATPQGVDDLLSSECGQTTSVHIKVAEIREALQTGNTDCLHAFLDDLQSWRRSAGDKDSHHDYWRVAQFVGETELSAICILLTLAVEKMDEADSTRWRCLEDLCRLLTVCLCNREIVYQLVNFCPSICSVLVLALNEGFDRQREGLCCKAAGVLEVAVTVCKWRFAGYLIDCRFLDPLLERLGHGDLNLLSLPLFEQILHLLKSLLMSGHPTVFQYTASCIDQLCGHFHPTPSPNGQMMIPDSSSSYYYTHHHFRVTGCNRDRESRDVDSLRSFLEQLQLSTRTHDTARHCAKHWTRNKSRKDLLSACLLQPVLLVFCSWPGCGLSNLDSKAFLRKCGACLTVRYCSRRCQESHWEMGHRFQCKPLAKRMAWLRHDSDC